MTTASQEIKITLKADAGGTPAVFSRAQKDLRGLGDAAGYTRQQMQQVQFQLTDIATGLASGQSPFTVLLQQGGQLKDTFGGVGSALKAVRAGVAEAFSVATVAAGAAVAAAGVFAYALYKGREQAEQFRDALALTGNAAGQTAGGFEAMANRVAKAGDVTRGTARELAEGLVASGRIGSAAIETVSAAAARVQAVSGQSSESIVGDFAGMANGVAAWAAEHNKAWHFVSAEQLDYIRTLEESGNAQKAMVVVGESLIEHLKGQRQQLGYAEAAWKSVKAAASSAWDSFLGIGRGDANTLEARLEFVNRRLAETAGAARGSAPGLDGARGYLNTLETERSTLLRDQLRQAEGASAASAAAQQVEDDIKRRQELRRVTDELSGANSQYAKTLKAIQDSAAAGDITEERRLQLLTEAAVKFGTRDGKKGEDPEAAYRRMVESTLRNRTTSLAQIEAQGYEAANRAAEDNMAKAAEQLAQRNAQAVDFGRQLERETEQINASLIADDEARGLAQIDIERRAQQERLDILAAGGADITAAQEALNRNMVARTAALREQLKPEWQKMVDAAGDAATSMRTKFDDGMATLLQSTEAAFTRWATGQKASFAEIGRDLSAALWRDFYRSDVAPLVAKGGASIFEALGLKRSGGGGGATDKADEWGAEFGKLIGITDKQTEATSAASQALSMFGKGLDGLGNIISSAVSAVIQFVASLSASSSSSGAGDFLGMLGQLFGGGGGDVGITSGNQGLVDYGLGGGRALGGRVRPGMDYPIGENGPERLRMYRGGGGYITPMTSGGGSGRASVHITQIFQAGVTPAMLAAHGEQIGMRVANETLESASRPGRPLWRAARRS